ncbi:hypothetical protein [Marinomonas transparens]|uniref:Uncharacterized protein n=1 Tax=Marinomonas transparens TaxID=2795388 RepID=A0A934JV61_9GAMM|nr:hypothetical protein [Marinomonas transparens]MBJ7537627.1 hypothetical protein [Marinomonas transparens]
MKNSVSNTIKQPLNKGGLFLSLHEALQEERTQPEAHITGRFLPALSGSNLSFNDGFIFSQMEAIGFSHMRHQYIDTPIGQLRLDIGVFEG